MMTMRLILVALALLLCNAAVKGEDQHDCPLQDCLEILEKAHHDKRSLCSGIYTIKPDRNLPAFKVYCDMDTDGGGWTVFQRRMDGSVDFYRKWKDYEYGFGSLEGEFWLGLDKISRLSAIKSCLQVNMKDFNNKMIYAKYTTFRVGGPDKLYKLTIGGYSGNTGDALSYLNQMPFSTKDKDNDKNQSKSCAEINKSALWYNNCHKADLNGLFTYGVKKPIHEGMIWYNLGQGARHPLKFTEMKMRRC